MSYLTTVKILDFFEKVNFWLLLLLLPLLGGIAGLGGSRQNFFLKPRLFLAQIAHTIRKNNKKKIYSSKSSHFLIGRP